MPFLVPTLLIGRECFTVTPSLFEDFKWFRSVIFVIDSILIVCLVNTVPCFLNNSPCTVFRM